MGFPNEPPRVDGGQYHTNGYVGFQSLSMLMDKLAICKYNSSMGFYAPKGLLFGRRRLFEQIGYRLHPEAFDRLCGLSPEEWTKLETKVSSQLKQVKKEGFFLTILKKLQRIKVFLLNTWLSSKKIGRIRKSARQRRVIHNLSELIPVSGEPLTTEVHSELRGSYNYTKGSRPKLLRNRTIPIHGPVGFKESVPLKSLLPTDGYTHDSASCTCVHKDPELTQELRDLGVTLDFLKCSCCNCVRFRTTLKDVEALDEKAGRVLRDQVDTLMEMGESRFNAERMTLDYSHRIIKETLDNQKSADIVRDYVHARDEAVNKQKSFGSLFG